MYKVWHRCYPTSSDRGSTGFINTLPSVLCRVQGLGSGSDFTPFFQNLGIASCDYSYWSAVSKEPTYSIYRTPQIVGLSYGHCRNMHVHIWYICYILLHMYIVCMVLT